jgi:hypothetical protein
MLDGLPSDGPSRPTLGLSRHICPRHKKQPPSRHQTPQRQPPSRHLALLFVPICLLVRKSLRASSKSTKSSGGLLSCIKTKGMEEFHLDSDSTARDPAELVLQKRMAQCSQWNRPAMSSPISSLVPQRFQYLLPPLLDLATVHLFIADRLGSAYPHRRGGRPSPSD